jgi:hypothetical protein
MAVEGSGTGVVWMVRVPFNGSNPIVTSGITNVPVTPPPAYPIKLGVGTNIVKRFCPDCDSMKYVETLSGPWAAIVGNDTVVTGGEVGDDMAVMFIELIVPFVTSMVISPVNDVWVDAVVAFKSNVSIRSARTGTNAVMRNRVNATEINLNGVRYMSLFSLVVRQCLGFSGH